MARRKVQSMASAIVRSLNKMPAPRGVRVGVASVSSARSLRSPAIGGGLGRGGGAMVASRTLAGRTASRAAPSKQSAGAIDLLVGRLASAVERRLGQPAAKSVAPPQPLSNAKIVNTIAAQVASAIPPARPAAPVNVAALDATAIADTVAKRIASGKVETHDPAAIVASQVLRRLSSLRIEGSTNEAQDFERRVAAAVSEVLTREGFGTEASAATDAATDDGQKAANKKPAAGEKA